MNCVYYLRQTIENTHLREAIPPSQRLSCSLRFLATGASFEELKFITAIAPQTIRKIIVETCEALIYVLKNNIKVSNIFTFIAAYIES